MESYRFSTWPAPKEIIGTLNRPPDTPSTFQYNDENDDRMIRRAKNRSSTNEFTAMLEYIQLNTVKQISQIESKKSMKEIELQNKIKQSEITNQRLISELTNLRNHYSKLLSHEDESNRTLLKIQNRLNRVGLLEYECNNKVEIERLTRLNQERKFEKDKLELQDLMKNYKEQVDRVMIQNQQYLLEIEDIRRIKLSNERKASAKLFFYILRKIYHRLQHRALCRWKGHTGASVIQRIAERQQILLKNQHFEELKSLESELALKHAEELNELRMKHGVELGELETKCSRLTISRDKIYLNIGLFRKDKSLHISEWKTQLIHKFYEQIQRLNESVSSKNELFRCLQSEFDDMKTISLQYKMIIHENQLQHVCFTIDKVIRRREARCIGRAFQRWRIYSKDISISQAALSIQEMQNATDSLQQHIYGMEKDMKERIAKIDILQHKVTYLVERLDVSFIFFNPLMENITERIGNERKTTSAEIFLGIQSPMVPEYCFESASQVGCFPESSETLEH